MFAIYEAGPEAVVELVTRLCGIIEQQNLIIEQQALQIALLEERVRHLEEMLEKNSRNSSKPPSTDSYARTKPKVKSQRKKSDRSAGGQNGHPGTTLRITGMRIIAVRNWLHVVETNKLTYYFPNKKRGSEVMDAMGILPDYTGVAIHDFWKPYNKYDCQHSLCSAHLLRELTGASENNDQQWSKIMSDLLMCIKHHVDNSLLDPKLTRRFSEDYNYITFFGMSENPPDYELNVQSRKRGRKRQTTVKNLLDRFIEFKEDILRFMYDPNVPFDNNQAERDIRMTKVQQKISGTFRSEQGARNFCRIGDTFLLSTRNLNLLSTRSVKYSMGIHLFLYAELIVDE